jgi:hypothetical protein
MGSVPIYRLLALLAAGCSTIGHVKVEGWPALEVVERYVPHAEMHARCKEYVTSTAMVPVACAQFDFVNARCYVWYNAEHPPSAATIAHERLHCQGYDHAGETTMRELLIRGQGRN